MNRNKKVREIAIAGLLTAIGILIPTMMPIKLVLPASTYTLASHVPIFIGMFISPLVGVMVALGTTFGFFISFPFVVAARAFSHLSFVIPGSFYLKKHALASNKQIIIFNFAVALVHGLFEFLVVALLNMKGLNTSLLFQFFLFLGIGTIIHSTVDFFLAFSIVKALELN